MKRPTPGRLLLLAPLLFAACSGAKSDSLQTAAVNINHSRFDPGDFHFRPGSTVRFVIHNADPIDHEFILGDALVQNRHENGTEKKHGAVPGEVSVPAGETRTTRYTFTSRGPLIIGCHLPGHYNYGMRAEVIVS
jgi:uncharacterized cupredoxin-like copper-binding protein